MHHKGTDHLTEDEIISRIKAGEKSLYEIIVRRYNPYLYKVGRSYNYNHEDTQDLMQETYIDAFKNLKNFEGKSVFKTWITRIMLNNCYRKKEKLSFKNEISDEDIDEKQAPLFSNSDFDTGKQVRKDELKLIIEEALSEIPEEFRMVFSLREISGFSVAETSELLNISESNVKVRLNRTKHLLREILEKSHEIPELYEFHLIHCDPFTSKLMDRVHGLHNQN